MNLEPKTNSFCKFSKKAYQIMKDILRVIEDINLMYVYADKAILKLFFY